MKVTYNITQNKFNATLNQETTEIKVSFKTGYYPLSVGLENYYTKNETDLILENYYLKSETYSQTEINGFLSGKQNTIGYTPENSANKSDSYTESSSTTYASTKALVDGLAAKQNSLANPISGTGTANYFPKFTASGTIGNSIVYENSNKIGVNTTPSDTLDIKTIGQGYIRFGGANGRTISAFNDTGVVSIVDFSSGASFLGNLYGRDFYDVLTNKQSVRLSSTNITFWTNSLQRLTLDINGNLSDSAGKFKSQRTITITENTTLSEIHNGAILHITNSCNITIPTGLDANFQCVVYAKGSIIVTFVNGGVAINSPSGLLLKTDKMASLFASARNIFNLLGELATS